MEPEVKGIKSYPTAEALLLEAIAEAVSLVTHGIERQAINSKAHEIYLTKLSRGAGG